MGESKPLDINLLIGIIERNQQALAQMCAKTDGLRVELLGQQNLCRVEHKNVVDGLERISIWLIEAMQEHSKIMEGIKEILVAHTTKVDMTDPALTSSISELKKKDEWVQKFLTIFGAVMGLAMSGLAAALIWILKHVGDAPHTLVK